MDWFQGQQRPLIIGHRGASAAAPENTLAAFKLAAAQGADGVEFDIQLSADGVPVVIHDRQVSRTTNGQGNVASLPLEALQKLDAGNGETIPTLDTVFETLGRDFLYNVELKVWGWQDKGLEAAAAHCLRRHNLTTQVLISSFNPWALRRMRQIMGPEAYLGFLHVPLWKRLGYCLFAGQADHPFFAFVNEEYMVWAKARRLPVNTWTVDDGAAARLLAGLGVTSIITNKPAFIREQLHAR